MNQKRIAAARRNLPPRKAEKVIAKWSRLLRKPPKQMYAHPEAFAHKRAADAAEKTVAERRWGAMSKYQKRKAMLFQ